YCSSSYYFSFDASEESVTSIVSRVILFSTIPTEILIVPDIPIELSIAPELPMVSPFLCSDDSEFEPADELPERHVSLGHFSAMVSRWRAKVISHPSSPSRSSLPDTIVPSTKIPVAPIPPAPSIVIATAPLTCDTLTPVIIASPAICSRIQTTARKSTLGLRPVITPARCAALPEARQATLSPEASSSSSSSDSTSHASDSSFISFSTGRPQCSDYAIPTSSSSVGPSRNRSRSSATSICHTPTTAKTRV
nr:hypothetical protein [Tanacetum cinerariifolium]